MSQGWEVVLCFFMGMLGMFVYRLLERIWAKRRPPRDTAELLNRIANVAHPLIEARLTCAWHEAELARIIDNVPPVFEDQVMLAAQLGQAIEQSVMRSVQAHNIPVVRLSGRREVDYAGWMSKWLRPENVNPMDKPVIVVSEDPQLPEKGSPSVPPSAMPGSPRASVPPRPRGRNSSFGTVRGCLGKQRHDRPTRKESA